MPIYMDIHSVPGLEAMDAADAHQKDMLIQDEYNCKCMTYWIDEARGSVFCLIVAPDKSSVEEMHRKSHGLVPHKIIEVRNEIVESFLGRIHDPEAVTIAGNGLKVFSDAAFRILLIIDAIDPVLLRYRFGREKAVALMNRQKEVIRKELISNGGTEAAHTGNGYIVSFSSAVSAISCALDISHNIPDDEKVLTGFKLAVNAGEPVAKSDKLFGDTIRFGRSLCATSHDRKIAVASVVRDLVARDYFQLDPDNFITLSPQDELFVDAVFNKLEENWQDTAFTVAEFCLSMAMSKSRLYRKTVALLGLPPNSLLKEFRLDKAKELLKRHGLNISQTTFDSGFTSPSYFTKCFKKKFGLLPAAYIQSVNNPD